MNIGQLDTKHPSLGGVVAAIASRISREALRYGLTEGNGHRKRLASQQLRESGKL